MKYLIAVIIVFVLALFVYTNPEIYSKARNALGLSEQMASYLVIKKPSFAGFSNTLQRRMGMTSAGAKEKYATNNNVGTFDATGEHFSSGKDVASNTMLSGYQNPTWLKV